MVAERRLTWRSSALDLPLALLIGLVLVQLALGNRPLAAWALAPFDPPYDLPAVFVVLGSIAPTHTARALQLFLTYAGAYVLVIQLIRTRRQLDRLVSTVLILGGLLAFAALLDHLARDAWLLRWRSSPATGRLAGTFANPDHFGAWLTMLILLGIGYLLARRGPDRRTSLRHLLDSRVAREEAIRRYWPFLALVTMAVALVFTLSRGALASALAAAFLLLVLLRALGRIRRSLALIGALLTATLAYATWIGLEPLLGRVWHANYSSRWIQAVSSLPILPSFPVLGVGLGTYQDIYLRYQPAALDPGHVYYTHAHNDLLQLVLEVGIVGTVLVLAAGWRTARDLLGAHLLGRAACPVGGGEADGARRNDAFSVGLAVGALGGVLALLVHSFVDFGARIAANGVLGATCLGIATVAVHTRFGPTGERLLTRVRVRRLEGGSVLAALPALAVGLSLALALWILRVPLVADRLAAATRPGVDRATAIGRVEAALTLSSHDERALVLRGRLRHQAALEIWNRGTTQEGRVLASWEERQQAALPLATGAVEDLRTAIRGVPSEPTFHGELARVEGTLALLDPQNRTRHLTAALAGFSRAAVLAPNDPYIQRTLALFAVPLGGRAAEIGLRAARAAVAVHPPLLPDLIDELLPVGLTPPQWVAMVPPAALDRAELGMLLEERGLLSAATHAYSGAIEVAAADQVTLLHWLRARLLLRQSPRAALAEIEVAVARDPDNAELYLLRGQALAALGDASALDALRLAVLKATVQPRRATTGKPFESLPARAEALVARALRTDAGASRYHRALARHMTDRRLWYQALPEWDAVLVERPEDAEAHFFRGVVLDGLGARERALQAYRQAVALDGTRSAFRLRLAERLWETEQYYQAMNEWRSVLGQAPGNIEARLGLARAAARAGDRATATQEYRHILQIAPDQPEARRELARLAPAR